MKPIISFLFLIALNSSAQTFNENSINFGIQHVYLDTTLMGGGAAFLDINNDDYIDIYLTGGDSRDQLYLNNQDGTYSEIGISAGIGFTQNIKTTGITSGDIDNDGYRDLFITTNEYYSNLLLKNNGDNTFTNISQSAGIIDTAWSTSTTFGDVNLDGYLDIYVSNYVTYLQHPFYNFIVSSIPNYLYLNNGDGTFNEVATAKSVANNGTTLANAFTDFNNDAHTDLFLANDFGAAFEGNALYKNLYPTIDFTNVAIPSGIYNEINGMGVAIGDYDEDQDFDYYITNMLDNLLHTNNSDETFNEDAFLSGVSSNDVVSWGTFFFDYNNDTYLDLFASSGDIMFAAPAQQNRLFENQQDGTFLDVSTAEGITDINRSRGAIYGDIDNDGDLDVISVNVESDPLINTNISVYKNNLANGNNWVKIKLIGQTVNKDAFGSKIELFSNGRSWIREIGGGSSYLSQNSSIAHFGLENYTIIDSIKITWIGGAQQVENIITINQLNEFTQSTLNIVEPNNTTINAFPNPTNNIVLLNYDGNEAIIIKNNLGQNITEKVEISHVNGQQLISLIKLQKGIYYIIIENKTIKIIKQ